MQEEIIQAVEHLAGHHFDNYDALVFSADINHLVNGTKLSTDSFEALRGFARQGAGGALTPDQGARLLERELMPR